MSLPFSLPSRTVSFSISLILDDCTNFGQPKRRIDRKNGDFAGCSHEKFLI
jgi:hypothetical protein